MPIDHYTASIHFLNLQPDSIFQYRQKSTVDLSALVPVRIIVPLGDCSHPLPSRQADTLPKASMVVTLPRTVVLAVNDA